MQVENRFLDDLARVANGAIGALSGIRGEIEGLIKQRVERLLADMDLVPRDEFEAVKAVAAKARSEQEALALRVAALEAALEPALESTKAKTKTKPKRAKRTKPASTAK
jgi:BMFP domain-containing protein YqiC